MSFSELPGPLGIAVTVSAVLCLGAWGFALYRAIAGPTPFDRVVALDLMGGICLCVIVLLSIAFGQAVLLDAAFGIALVSFLGTVTLARFLGKRRER